MIRHAYLTGLSVILAITPKPETNLIHSIVLEHADHYAKTHTSELFEQMDSNKDGVISLHEFITFIRNKQEMEEVEDFISLVPLSSCFGDINQQVAMLYTNVRAMYSQNDPHTKEILLRRKEFLQFYFTQSIFPLLPLLPPFPYSLLSHSSFSRLSLPYSLFLLHSPLPLFPCFSSPLPSLGFPFTLLLPIFRLPLFLCPLFYSICCFNSHLRGMPNNILASPMFS